MNTQIEPTEPGGRSESPADRPSPLRVALLSAAFVALSAHTVLSKGDALSPVGPVSAPAREPYQTANSLIEEIHAKLEKTSCHFADKAVALARLKELPDVIPSWQQTARVEPSELLRSLQRIAETTNCPALSSAAASSTAASNAGLSGEVENRSLATEVGKLQTDLEKQLQQDIRSLFARLRKAQREGDQESASRSVSELQDLLQYHQGPLRQHLDRLARLYQDS